MIPPCVPMTVVVTAYGWVEHDSRCRLLSALVSVPVSDSDGCSVDGAEALLRGACHPDREHDEPKKEG